MKKFTEWLNTNFAPKMQKVNRNPWIGALKDSIMQILPMIFLGSIFVMLAILNDFIPSLPSFWTPFGYTMGFVSIFIGFLIPFNLMERKKIKKSRFYAGIAGLSLYLIILNPVSTDVGLAFPSEGFGAGGMFVAIVAGLYAALIFNAFGKFSFFKEDSIIPDFVRSWFDAMLPVGLVILTGWLFIDILQLDVYELILAIFLPLQTIIETPYGFSLLMFVYTFLYSMGISSWVLQPVARPVMLAAITANIAAVAAGQTGTNIVTSETIYSAYMWVGGIGATFPLVIMLVRSKVKKLKALGAASLLPAVFNINEPVVFGAIAWNPLLMLPMWLIGLILPLTTWFGIKLFAPVPAMLFDLWYAPFPIGTLTLTGFTGLILLIINIAVATAIWYPFFKVYEKQELEFETTID